MFAPADDYVRLVIHNALRLAIINYGPHMLELVGRYRLPLAGGAQDNSAGLIRIFGNFTGYRHHEVRVVVMLVVAECALVTHFMPLRLEVLDKFFFEPIPRVVRADVDFHTQIIHFRARNENCPPNSSRRGRVSITKRDPEPLFLFRFFWRLDEVHGKVNNYVLHRNAIEYQRGVFPPLDRLKRNLIKDGMGRFHHLGLFDFSFFAEGRLEHDRPRRNLLSPSRFRISRVLPLDSGRRLDLADSGVHGNDAQGEDESEHDEPSNRFHEPPPAIERNYART